MFWNFIDLFGMNRTKMLRSSGYVQNIEHHWVIWWFGIEFGAYIMNGQASIHLYISLSWLKVFNYFALDIVLSMKNGCCALKVIFRHIYRHSLASNHRFLSGKNNNNNDRGEEISVRRSMVCFGCKFTNARFQLAGQFTNECSMLLNTDANKR